MYGNLLQGWGCAGGAYVVELLVRVSVVGRCVVEL